MHSIKSHNIRIILIKLLSIITRLFIKVRILDKFVLVRVDGGICSQIHFYMIGQHFKEMGCQVKYDLSWFKTYGYDMLNKDRRDYALGIAFPYLEIQTVSKMEFFFYKSLNRVNDFHDETSAYEWMGVKAPVYMTGYYRTPSNFFERFSDMFYVDETVFDLRNREMFAEIKSEKNSVAIHVRRGDLAVFTKAYGEPVPVSYFKNSIDFICKRVENPHFYIFSDDYDWVEDVLLPEIGAEIYYTKIDFNDSSKGYFDLFLMAECQHKITSKGSFGKYSAFIGKKTNSIITVYDDKYEIKEWEGKCSGFVFIK